MHYPAISFTDSRGTQHEFVSHTGTNPPQYSRGDRVTVLYDVTQPEGEFQLESFLSNGVSDSLSAVWGCLIFWRVSAWGYIVASPECGTAGPRTRNHDQCGHRGLPAESAGQYQQKHPWRIHARIAIRLTAESMSLSVKTFCTIRALFWRRRG
jgi:hypothetical protein